jgi:uncharacterized damage-inducible protein DinB
MSATRLALAATPWASAAWQPHPRSLPLARLAAHLADIPRWTPAILGRDHYDVAGARPPAVSAVNAGALLASFDANVGAALDALDTADPQGLEAPWELRRGGVVIATFTREQSVRLFVLHHAIHHRGQLALYLRLLGVAVAAECEPFPRTPA